MKFLIKFSLLFSTIHLSCATDISKIDKKNSVKQKINSNMTITYQKRPNKVDRFTQIFTEGIFYGRLRSNTFIFDSPANSTPHYAIGLGGSLIYKSARYKGFSFTTGLYGSQSLNHVKTDDIGEYHSGKDTFSRYAVATHDRDGMMALAQNYLSFKKDRVELKVGRFLLETAMLKSHDTKMIPNAFEGASLQVNTFPNTKIELAYITKQKLRDHENFHRVLAYNDDPTPYAQWSGNDDGAMHRGLTSSKLDAKGIDDHIIVLEAKNRSIENTTLQASYTAVPQLLSSLMLEGSYKFKLENGLKIKPAIRYLHQFDDGAGAIGGANLKTDTIGYANPNSLENDVFASRVDFIYGAGLLRIGYSNVNEGGDIVSPWHAQVTAGYSRAMSGSNWYANTKTTMIRADYDLSKAGLMDGVHLVSRYAIEDFDDHKSGTPSDMNIFTFDIVKHFTNHPNLFFKVRTALMREDHSVKNIDGSFKKNPTNNAMRLEINYLF